MEDLSGSTIGPYCLDRMLGKGGMSVVYLARRQDDGKTVALKLLGLQHKVEPEKIRRFWDGGQTAKQLNHPHIVRVHDVGLADGHYYIAMDYVEGGPADDWIGDGRGSLTLEQRVDLLRQIAEAVDYAHRKGVVHRDIKPSNILLSTDGSTAYLADFGIARLTGREMVTSFGRIVGTPEFISPEQIQGQRAGPLSDIYALGITAFQMMTGQLPFEGDPLAVMHQHVHARPPSARSLNQGVWPAADRAIRQAMAKQPEERPPTAIAFTEALRGPDRSGPSRGLVWLALASAAVVLWIVWLALGPSVPPADPVATTAATVQAGGLQVPIATHTVVAQPTSTIRRLLATAVPAVNVELTSTRAPATKSAASTAAPTRIASTVSPSPDVLVLELLAPETGAKVPRDRSTPVFEWKASRPLATNEAFELRFFRAGDETYRAPFGWRRESRVDDINLDNLTPGEYRWQVVVVQGIDGRWEADLAASPLRTLLWGQ